MAIVDIDRLDWSQAVVAKVNSKHHLTIDDVESAVENYEQMAWDHHHQHGTRLLVRGRTEHGRAVRVVLYPTDSIGVFNVGTAFCGVMLRW